MIFPSLYSVPSSLLYLFIFFKQEITFSLVLIFRRFAKPDFFFLFLCKLCIWENTLMHEGKAYRRWCSTPLCWLNNGAQVALLPLCPSLLNSGTAVNPPAQNRNFTIKMQLAILITTASTGQQTCPCVWVTHISGWLLQILVVHMNWDDLCGQRTGGVWLRQLPFKLRLNEVQLPAGD